jgi:hypothetical protein
MDTRSWHMRRALKSFSHGSVRATNVSGSYGEPGAILEGLDFRIVAAAITAFASIGVFFAGRFVALLADRAKARARRNALVSAVFTEIRHNLEDLEDSIGDLIGDAELRRHFENKPNGNVLIVYSRNMVFFDLLRGEMTVLPTPVLERAVRFYSQLEKVYRYCDSVSGETFQTISIDGKMSVLHELKKNIDDAILCGNEALDAFRQEFGRAVLGPEALRSPRARDRALSPLHETVLSGASSIARSA